MWHHRALEREIHHTTSKLCILGFEPLKQGTKIDGQRPGTSQRFSTVAPLKRPVYDAHQSKIFESGIAMISPRPEYLPA